MQPAGGIDKVYMMWYDFDEQHSRPTVVAENADASMMPPKVILWREPRELFSVFCFLAKGGEHMHDTSPSFSMNCERLGLFVSSPPDKMGRVHHHYT